MNPATIHPLPDTETLAYTIDEAIQASRVGRSTLYIAIKAGELPIVKAGRRTLIRRAALDEFLRGLERRTGPRAA